MIFEHDLERMDQSELFKLQSDLETKEKEIRSELYRIQDQIQLIRNFTQKKFIKFFSNNIDVI